MKMQVNSPTYNVYRTKCFVVGQELYFDNIPDDTTTLFSKDTYYLRNKKLDKQYEKIYQNRDNVNGKRIHVCIYKRNYIL
jgi:hypothetical protein